MKNHKMIRMLIQKNFWDFDRNRNIEFFDKEGSFILDTQIETRRLKVILKLMKEHNLKPTPKLIKIVDFCVFITKDLANSLEYAYKLFFLISPKFSSNFSYNKLLAKREIKKFQYEHVQKYPNVPFNEPYKKVTMSEYNDHERAMRRVGDYLKYSLTPKERNDAVAIQIVYYEQLYGLT